MFWPVLSNFTPSHGMISASPLMVGGGERFADLLVVGRLGTVDGIGQDHHGREGAAGVPSVSLP